MTGIPEQVNHLFALENCTFTPVSGHEGGRNQIVIISRNGEKQSVLRISVLGDRSKNDYLAETEFVRFLAENGAPVADVIPSVHGRLSERVEADGKTVYVSLFAYAKGMLLADNGYRYREGTPLSEYFYNTGKALGAIHRLSKAYVPVHHRPDYFDKYNMEYLDRLIPAEYDELKTAIAKRLEAFRALPKDKGSYGLVHFDFSDGIRKIYSLCNTEGIEIRYENDDTAFSIAFSREDRNKLPLSGQKNGKINDHISALEQTVLSLLRDDPRLTYAELILKTGKSQRTLSRVMDVLKRKGLITRAGSNKTGYWQVM